MKRFYCLLLTAFLAGFAMTACEKSGDNVDPTPPPAATVYVSPNSLSFQNVDDTPQTVTVTATSDEWTVQVAADGKKWCTAVSKVEEEKTVVSISVEENTELASRQTKVYVRLEDAVDSVTVTQLGIEPSITPDQASYDVTAEEQPLTIGIAANVEYTVTVAEDCDWLVWDEENSTTDQLLFSVEENTDTEPRSTTVTIAQKEGDLEPVVVTINQAAGENTELPETEDVLIPVLEMTAPATASSYPIANAYDGDITTFWQMPSAGESSPVELRFTFDESTPRINYFVYYPSTPYGQFGEVEVYYEDNFGREQLCATHDFGMASTPDTIRFEGETGLQGVTTLILKVKTANGRSSTPEGNVMAGIAEIAFYHTSAMLDALEIFTDYSCSELLPKINEENLGEIADTVLRRVASEMLAGTYDPKFRVATYKPYPHPDLDADRFGTNTYTKLDNVTGMAVLTPGVYTVCVDETYNTNVTISVIDFETNEYGNNCDYTLRKGVNHLDITHTGLVFVKYHTTSTAAQPIKIHFPNMPINGYYDMEEMVTTDFQPLLLNAKQDHFIMRGRKSVLVFPVEYIRRYTTTGSGANNLLKMTDSIISMEEDLQGHFKYNTGGHRNRMLYRVTYGKSYMYSSAYQTAYSIPTMRTILNANNLLSGIWGPAHEVGHSNQIAKGMKWAGTTEVTNNICSAYVQYTTNGARDGKGTALYQHSEATSLNNHYDMGYRDIMLGGRTHFGAGSFDEMYYVKVVPFWQLYLYYTYVGGRPDLYRDLYNEVRNRTNNSTISDGEAQLAFVKSVCDIVQEDLTEFFEAWGFLTPIDGSIYISDYGVKNMRITQEQIDEVKNHIATYPKPAYKLQFITEGNIDRFNGGAPTAGTFRISNSQIVCSGFSNVVAYELRDEKDSLLMYSSRPTFRYTTCDLIWVDEDKNPNPAGNFSTSQYYCTQKGTVKIVTPSSDWKVYGIAADGTRVGATNNPLASLDVMSFNLKVDNVGDANSWDNRRDAVISMINQEKPTVIGTQEAQPHMITYISRNCPNYGWYGLGRDTGDVPPESDTYLREESATIFYDKDRVEMLEHGTFWLSETPDVPSLGWDAGYNRTCTWGLFREKDSGLEFYFFNTHLDNSGSIARTESMKLIVNKMAEINTNNFPAFITADFNSNTNQDCFLPLQAVMKDARQTAPETDNNMTYNGFSTTGGRMLDHIFYSGDCTPTLYHTLIEDYGVPFISDHYPIKAHFNLY